MKKYLGLILFLIPALTANAQNNELNNTLSVYLDCRGCNSTFIRSETPFINFVRDQADSDLHLIITRQGTGSGGTQYTLRYIGQEEFSSLSKEFNYVSFDSDTEDEERNGLVQHVKLGFVPFLIQKGALSDFDVSFIGNAQEEEETTNTDKWNSWLFEVGGNTWFSGEESENDLNLNGRFRARRITEGSKFTFNYNYGYSRSEFKDDDTTEVFTTDNQNVNGLYAISLSDHWSVGAYFSGGSSSRDNIDLRYGATPSVEYSFYPYREYARREVTLRYGILTSFYDYTETTIYNKNSEILTRQELAFNMDYTQPWGGIEGRLNGRAYLHDLSKNRLNMNIEVDFRVFRGFFISFETGYSIINDQLSLPLDDDVTTAEALANTRQQATSFEYYGFVGIEITFGSIFDSVVNTRF